MKILWVGPNFLHPTTKGGQIRSLEMLRRLHRRHEVHYVAFSNPDEPEGPRRSSEYAAHAHPFPLRVPPRMSFPFLGQLAANLFSSLPLAVSRYVSPELARHVDTLSRDGFDSIVCDFLFMAPNVPDLSRAVLFQHNVESMIWERHSAYAADPLRKSYFRQQARRMLDYERKACQSAGHVVAVSDVDEEKMRSLFGISHISRISTGVDIDSFAPPPPSRQHRTDLIFTGSMDWMPNIDGALFFVNEVIPLIRRRRPDCSLAIVGRTPTAEIHALARRDPYIQVTGTVPDVRPYLWDSAVSVVPLRIGGGTRLKIYEAMAARLPVVSTAIGAEGLPVSHGEHLLIADSPQDLADRCLELLDDAALRERLCAAAWDLIASRFSWDQVVTQFENILAASPPRSK